MKNEIVKLETQERGFETTLRSCSVANVEEKLNEDLKIFIDKKQHECNTQSGPLESYHIGK